MLAIQDYSEALNLAEDEPICRIIRGRISVVYFELGTSRFDQNDYAEADHHYSLAIEYHIHITYLIQRSKARILLGNEKGAKLDAIAAYKVDPFNRELIPLLARLFPTTGLPEVEDHLMRHFPHRETTLRAIKVNSFQNCNYPKLINFRRIKNQVEQRYASTTFASA
jgi:tetratricopeptide (TPR) repeat protein